MFFWKKTLALLISFLLLFSAVSCGTQIIQNETDSNGNPVDTLAPDDESNKNGNGNNDESQGDNENGNGNESDAPNGGNSSAENPPSGSVDDGDEEKETVDEIEGDGEEIKNDISRYVMTASPNNTFALSAAISLNSLLNEKNISLELNEPSLYEIIIGNGELEQTKSALTAINNTDKDYIIKFIDEKIIIAAKSNLALEKACAVFYELYVKDLTSKSLNVKSGTVSMGSVNDLAILTYGGAAQYEIVFGNVSNDVKTKADELVKAIKTTCGASSVKVGATYSASKNQILIGQSTYTETLMVLSAINATESATKKVNNKIVVTGKNDGATSSAIESFITQINEATPLNLSKGNFTMYMKKTSVDSFCASLSSIPAYSNATYKTSYPSGTGITQLYYTAADPNGINGYVSTLASLGYKKTEDNSVNGNRFVTCYGANGLVHISYVAHTKTLTVILDSLAESVYKQSEPDYTKVTETSLAVISLDYDRLESTSGMSLAITLEDGRYIIIDGGFRNESDGSRDSVILYNYLKDNNKRPDGKIVIAAWIFTHDHGDHYGAFLDFCDSYHSTVELQYYIQNFGDASRYDQTPNGWLEKSVSRWASKRFYAKKIVPHTGQKITFCSTTFEFLCTQESHVPNKMEWVNDASLIFRMTANGVTTLFLADAEAQTTNLLLKMYGSTLKSDIMQVPHHGYSGGSTDLYKKVAPNWAIWPCSTEAYNQRIKGGGNGSAQTQNLWLAKNVATHYVGDGSIEILKFVGDTQKISFSGYAPKFT